MKERNVVTLARDEMVKFVLYDILDELWWLSVIPRSDNNGLDEDGFSESCFDICIRRPDYLMDKRNVDSISIVTFVDNGIMKVYVGYDSSSFLVYSGRIGFEEPHDEGWDTFFEHIKKGMKFWEMQNTIYTKN